MGEEHLHGITYLGVWYVGRWYPHRAARCPDPGHQKQNTEKVKQSWQQSRKDGAVHTRWPHSAAMHPPRSVIKGAEINREGFVTTGIIPPPWWRPPAGLPQKWKFPREGGNHSFLGCNQPSPPTTASLVPKQRPGAAAAPFHETERWSPSALLPSQPQESSQHQFPQG